ncbi:MAG: zf-HC2 domain-containing protein [Gemmatimonadales bacterium]
MNDQSMTCAAFEALVGDYLEAHALAPAQRAAADAHVRGCPECSALLADVRTIVRDALDLPVLTPSRDLWRGIEERIEAPVVAIGRHTGEHAASTGPRDGSRGFGIRRLAVAASLLVAVTAGVTYTLTKRQGELPVTPDSSGTSGATSLAPFATPASNPGAEETFDREIASMRAIVDARRSELDTATTRVVERNLKLIDAAITESKAALAADPASAFLLDQLTRAYDTKLRLLRGLATLPARS